MRKLSDYNFDLPEELIAQTPLENREDSRLMVLKGDDIIHTDIHHFIDHLSDNDVLVFNKSRVIPARIPFKNENGNAKEIFLSKKNTDGSWDCLVHPGKYFKEGRVFDLPGNVKAKIMKVNEDWSRSILFSSGDNFDFSSWLQKYGEVPKPTYIKSIEDASRYQTVFAEEGNSVAAPTAGLHFTHELLEKIQKKGIEIYFVHLDVGVGTFMPVKFEDITDHNMHSERFFLTEETADALNKAKKKGKRVISVGTTSTRVLESCADNKGELLAQSGETDIFIYPGYTFKFIDALFTNFHTPYSTLLMLVSAFAGKEKIFHAYSEAVKDKYRFYSFGDAMFIEN